MSREILFRGKTYSYKWVYGYLLKGSIDNDFYILENIGGTPFWINPETVGQFTGLIDKNGKKIFEGDIVQGTIVSAWNKALIRCEVVYNKDGFISVERTRNQEGVHKVKFAKDIEVIGNIHDNKELLQNSK